MGRARVYDNLEAMPDPTRPYDNLDIQSTHTPAFRIHSTYINEIRDGNSLENVTFQP